MYSRLSEKLDFVLLFFALEYPGWRIFLRKAVQITIILEPLGKRYSEQNMLAPSVGFQKAKRRMVTKDMISKYGIKVTHSIPINFILVRSHLLALDNLKFSFLRYTHMKFLSIFVIKVPA